MAHDEFVKELLVAVNKALLDGNKKDEFRSQMHQSLVTSGWRAQMERKVHEMLELSGSIDDIDIDTLIKEIIGSLSAHEKSCINQAKQQTVEHIVNYLSELSGSYGSPLQNSHDTH